MILARGFGGWTLIAWLALVTMCAPTPAAFAHDGPPFPIVSDQRAGAYTVSVWTDPDATDDGSPGGQFWVMIAPGEGSVPIAAATSATVTVTRLDRAGPRQVSVAVPVRNDPATQFAAVVLDREGPFHVRVAINGPRGRADVEADVTATYNLRPPPLMIVVSLAPFVLVGLLWAKVLVSRRRASSARVR